MLHWTVRDHSDVGLLPLVVVGKECCRCSSAATTKATRSGAPLVVVVEAGRVRRHRSARCLLKELRRLLTT